MFCVVEGDVGEGVVEGGGEHVGRRRIFFHEY